MFSFKYSPRPNTLALKRMPDDVGEDGEDAADRGAAGAAEGHPGGAVRGGGRPHRARAGRRDAAAGATGSSRAARSGNTVVNFAGDAAWIGRIVPVRITAANPNSLRGESCADTASASAERTHGSA